MIAVFISKASVEKYKNVCTLPPVWQVDKVFNMIGSCNIKHAMSKLFLRHQNLLEVQEDQVDQVDPVEGENGAITFFIQ